MTWQPLLHPPTLSDGDVVKGALFYKLVTKKRSATQGQRLLPAVETCPNPLLTSSIMGDLRRTTRLFSLLFLVKPIRYTFCGAVRLAHTSLCCRIFLRKQEIGFPPSLFRADTLSTFPTLFSSNNRRTKKKRQKLNKEIMPTQTPRNLRSWSD